MADFIGFTLNGIHSSDLNIVRVSNGDRFELNLLPSIADRTSQITGRDGTYYYGRDYKNTSISINVAYDSMSEQQKRKLQSIINQKEPFTLIFDEAPYKQYYVLATSSSKLNYICFSKHDVQNSNDLYTHGNDTGTERIYRGEGTLVFTLYEPYAYSTHKYTNYYTGEQLIDWNESIGLRNSRDIDKWITGTSNYFLVYNPGDIEAKPKITLKYRTDTTSAETTGRTITMQLDSGAVMTLTNLKLAQGDAGIVIDSELELITGINATGVTTGTLYNQYLTNGYFISIPVSYDSLQERGSTHKLIINPATLLQNSVPILEYDYRFV